ncbi:hypothetical protein [Bacillus phage vB_BanS-Thrax3]|nr:hypothetical protein [Bacillus phage vB_BanS-Thrax3]
MRSEQEIKAKINYLTKVKDRIDKRREEVVNKGGGWSNLSTDEKRVFSVLLRWSEKASIQRNALYYALYDTNELSEIECKISGLEPHEITGGEDLFKLDPTGFVIRTREGNYLEGWSIEHRRGKDYTKYETTIYRAHAVVFEYDKKDSIGYITDGLLNGWEFEYIYE